MEILFATSNPHKLEEARSILAPLGIRTLALDSLPKIPPEPEETGLTFEENARIKALAYAAFTGISCLAEDSGIEVDALGGAPGVYSARYAGETGTRAERDRRNNEKLLNALVGVPVAQRGARFVCALCLAARDQKIIAETRGTFEGRIVETPRGQNGFGYDPLLFLPELGCTSAELTSEQKNARSHRGDAIRKLAWVLRPGGGST
jgi:XTP/dITP diphosphohydrolase